MWQRALDLLSEMLAFIIKHTQLSNSIRFQIASLCKVIRHQSLMIGWFVVYGFAIYFPLNIFSQRMRTLFLWLWSNSYRLLSMSFWFGLIDDSFEIHHFMRTEHSIFVNIAAIESLDHRKFNQFSDFKRVTFQHFINAVIHWCDVLIYILYWRINKVMKSV